MKAPGSRRFDRVRVPRADEVTDWAAVKADIEAEVAHLDQASSALIAAGSLTFVVAPILHATHSLPTPSYVVVAVLAGAGVFLALTAALIRTGPRTLGARGENEDHESLKRFRRKELFTFFATWLVGLGLALLFVFVLVGRY